MTLELIEPQIFLPPQKVSLPSASLYSPIYEGSIGSRGAVLALGDLHLGPDRDHLNVDIFRDINRQLDANPKVEAVLLVGDTYGAVENGGIERILETWGEDMYQLNQRVSVIGVFGDHDNKEWFEEGDLPPISGWCHRAVIDRDNLPDIVFEHRPVKIEGDKVSWEGGSRLDEYLPKGEGIANACKIAEDAVSLLFRHHGLRAVASFYLFSDILDGRRKYPDSLLVRAHCHAAFQWIQKDGTGYVNTGVARNRYLRLQRITALIEGINGNVLRPLSRVG